MNLNQIESKIRNLVTFHNPFEFIFEFLAAYNIPKATVTRLKKGNSNLSKQQGEVILKKKLFFREELMMDLHESISILEKSHKHNERFLIVTDWKTFLAIDTKTKDKLDTDFKDLPKHYDFFLPWAGMEKTQHANENPADVKAAEKMAKLFDAIKQNNPDDSEEFVHSLNVFLSRLLFCFFAEDTNIFEENQFTNAISSHTQPDGSDLDGYLDKLFEVLNTPPRKRENLPSYLEAFPYVNGGLFKDKLKVPKFNRKARQSIIDSGELNWSDINPDIFGSMFQAVIDVDQRGSLGQHYTSVPNIMKVIEPLFLNELNEEFENAKGNKKKLVELLERLKNIKIFDPACGSGNFLIIAYKELRSLEIKILEELKYLAGDAGTVSMDFGTDYLSHISLNNFYGIELDDFAHEIAKLALWLAEHQMNLEFFSAIGHSNPTLPLKDAGKIFHGNAAVLDWEQVCPINEEDELYILGNPPYLGTRNQKKNHKEDVAKVLKHIRNYKSLDYIFIWFYKASMFTEKSKAKYAFVSTNSICQGDQVPILWPLILEKNEIFFVHQSFNWNNNAKGNAGVSVIVIGIQAKSDSEKRIYGKSTIKFTENINAYLIDAPDVYITRKSKPFGNLPEMIKGSIPADGGHWVLDKAEADELLTIKEISPFIKKFVGSQELIKGIERYCLYIKDDELESISRNPIISRKIEGVIKMRSESTKKATVELAKYPNRFAEDRYYSEPCLLVPCVTSGRREYMPIGFIDAGPVIYASAQAIYNAQPWVFAIMNSKLHMVWVKTVGGRLREDIRYSSSICYNSFPFYKPSGHKLEELTKSALQIIEVRESYSDRTLSELYAPDKMPDDLKMAHQKNDELVERCYRITPFSNDEERLEYLFKLYGKMIHEEQSASTLFAKQKKTKKKS